MRYEDVRKFKTHLVHKEDEKDEEIQKKVVRVNIISFEWYTWDIRNISINLLIDVGVDKYILQYNEMLDQLCKLFAHIVKWKLYCALCVWEVCVGIYKYMTLKSQRCVAEAYIGLQNISSKGFGSS